MTTKKAKPKVTEPEPTPKVVTKKATRTVWEQFEAEGGAGKSNLNEILKKLCEKTGLK